jgi:predicted transcriptional regulator
MDQYIKQEVYNLDGNTQLEFLNRKTIVVIDKDRFSICKQLLLEGARDEDFAEFLNIPPEKVRYFKYKMQLFEDKIRARRRAARLNSKRRRREAKPPPQRKREISSEERFRRARDLIARNYSTNQISKILKVSERSVTRFKSRIRAEKMRLAVEGKLKLDPDDPDDQNSFKHLKPQDKVRRAQELFKRRLRITEISEILKISERSVRRWKERLNKLASAPPSENDETLNIPKKWHPERNLRAKAIKVKREVEENDDDEEDTEPEKPAPKKRKMFVDREKVQYARELIDNKLSNKEMSTLLEMSIACVRKLKMKILNGTVEELIDNSEEHYASLTRQNDDEEVEMNPDGEKKKKKKIFLYSESKIV